MIEAIQSGVAGAVASMQSGVTLVNAGSELASGAGSAVTQATYKVSEVATMVGEISAALHEQRSSSELIAEQVRDITAMAERNTRACGATTQSAVRLNELSANMQAMVSHFRV